MDWWNTIWQTLLEAGGVALLVAGMMLVLALLNYSTKDRIVAWLGRTKAGQVLLASVMGVIPGCMGGYFTVSMYTQGMIGFGALAAMMMATTGDEAFLMLAQFPGTALAVMAGLLLAGLILGLCLKDARVREVSGEQEGSGASLRERLLGVLPDAAKVFLWTFGIMLAVHVAESYIDLSSWVGDNAALMILLAVLIGFIPQSGPHMVFVTMYATGVLPLPVLLANCIVQDGHAGLPLLAADKAAFFKIKAIKAGIALAVAFAMLLF